MMKYLHSLAMARQAGGARRRGFSLRLESLEERTLLDAGDTLATALVTNLGPAPGNYQMYVEALGDGGQAARDVDLYRFQAGAGGILTARTSPAAFGAPMDPLLRLFDSAGVELSLNEDFATTRYGRIDYQFATAGTYYLGVSGSPNASYNPAAAGSGVPADDMGNYGLELTLIAAPAVAADAEDYAAAATWTDIYGVYTTNGYYASNHRLGDGFFGATDVDVFFFYAFEGTTVNVRTLAPHGAAPQVDTYLRLFNEFGVEVASNDDGPSEYGLFSLLSFAITTSSYYYIGVSGHPNTAYDVTAPGSGVAGEAGLYRLEVFLTDVNLGTLNDIGDSILTAEYLTLSSGGYAQVTQRIGDGAQTVRDVDMYLVVAGVGQTLMLLTSRAPGVTTVDTALRLFDANGFELAMNDDGGVGLYSFLSYRFRTAGTYYIGVSSYPNYAYLPFTDGSGVAGGTGGYTFEAYLFTGGAGPGGAPGEGGGNGSDLVLGLIEQEAAPAAVEAQPSQGADVPVVPSGVTPVFASDQAEAVQTGLLRSEGLGTRRELLLVLELVLGDWL